MLKGLGFRNLRFGFSGFGFADFGFGSRVLGFGLPLTVC